MTREVAQAMAREDPHGARVAIWRGLGVVATYALAAAAITSLAAPTLAIRVFADPSLTGPLRVSAIIILPLCLSAAMAGALAGLHRLSLSQMIYSWSWPAIFCLIAAWSDLNLDNAFNLLLGAVTLTAVLSSGFLIMAWPRGGERTAPALSLGQFAALGFSLFTTEVVQLLVAALPALVLGVVASKVEVGIYAMAWRLAMVVNLLVVTMAAVASPRFAAAAARGDTQGLKHTAMQTLAITIALGAVPLLALAIGAPSWLSLFGEGFADGATALRILLAAQAIHVLAACTPEMLGMAGYERPMQRVNQIAVLVYGPLIVALCVWAGDVGAAIATLVMAMITAIGSSMLAQRHLGFVPLALLLGVGRARLKAH
jgi:O-antigen/teichoic acid export membrane protein